MTRIVAGSRRGHRLAVPPGEGTRPTTDRVREALFSAVVSWAGTGGEEPHHALAGLAFADLFAGSGAVGLEAASRGAHPVLLVEAAHPVAALAARNAAGLGLDVEVRTGRVGAVLRAPAPRAYDVVFLDPPYDLPGAGVDDLLAGLPAGGWLAPSALVVAERRTRDGAPAWPGAFEAWSRRYGETTLHFGAR